MHFSTAPASGAVITVGYVFHVPVRFDIDQLDMNYSHFTAAEIPSIPIVELKL